MSDSAHCRVPGAGGKGVASMTYGPAASRPLGPDALPAALASLGEALRARPLGPDPDFRAALRARCVAVATVAPHNPSIAAASTRRRSVDLRLRFARIAVAGVAAS